MPTKPQTYQLKITLNGIRPPIWRRVLVADDSTLNDLHYVIQAAINWTDSHLHKFEVKRKSYMDPFQGDPYPGGFFGSWAEDEAQVQLRDLKLTAGERFYYEYDFGDSWGHSVLVEKILPRDPEVALPVCLKGKRAGPPDGCGALRSTPRLKPLRVVLQVRHSSRP